MPVRWLHVVDELYPESDRLLNAQEVQASEYTAIADFPNAQI